MADIPHCRDCGKRDFQRLLSETDDCWYFGCLRCMTRWIVSKPHIKARSAYQIEADKVRRATEAERLKMSRRIYFT